MGVSSRLHRINVRTDPAPPHHDAPHSGSSLQRLPPLQWKSHLPPRFQSCGQRLDVRGREQVGSAVPPVLRRAVELPHRHRHEDGGQDGDQGGDRLPGLRCQAQGHEGQEQWIHRRCGDHRRQVAHDGEGRTSRQVRLPSAPLPLGAHLVHYNMKYPNISEAIKHKDGLAVLGFVYTVGPKNSAPMDSLTKAFANVVKKDTVYDMPTPFALADAADPFVNTDKLDFYRYNGGLTTPTCNEVVTWTVVTQPLSITEEQLARFRTLKDKDSGNITTNYRPVQPLNGRKITGFFHDKKTDDDDC